MAALTPMLKQYYQIKSEYQDAILLFRLGDFYEMFDQDARVAASALDLVLTSRQKGANKIPMCGVPYHAIDSYIAKLVKQGYKVAICDQVEDPSQAKGIVRREVTRVLTPGTLDSANYLDNNTNCYLLSCVQDETCFGLAWADLTTGELFAKAILGQDLEALLSEITRLGPREIVLPEDLVTAEAQPVWIQEICQTSQATISKQEDWAFVNLNALQTIKEHFGVIQTDGLGFVESSSITRALGGLLNYLLSTQKQALPHLKSLQIEQAGEYLFLDASTIKSLEILSNLHDPNSQASLLAVYRPYITTSMGKRLLANYLTHPLLDLKTITKRQEAVLVLQDEQLQKNLKTHLFALPDLQRITARLALGRILPRELLALNICLLAIQEIKLILGKANCQLLKDLNQSLQPLPDLVSMIQQTIKSDPPAVTNKGGYIQPDFHSELNELVNLKKDSKKWIKDYEQQQKAQTRINSLKIGYNRVFGYYLEITKTHLAKVPQDYQRKQTLVNAERYITSELKEYEAKILGAEERILQLEHSIYEDLLKSCLPYLSALQKSASGLAQLDVLLGFAKLAKERHYCQPKLNQGGKIEIKAGRHPVVESLLTSERFIPNDALIDNQNDQIIILTGPNMAGKSTWLRQVALITLMAQIGSFVPADSATIGLVDRIFTRIGASDDLGSGQSTFMLEMQETANILNNATPQSLVILDEIGRGTSTYDGLSIAWAVIEYLHRDPVKGSRTLFATHYHELIQLEQDLKRCRNYNIAVKKIGDNIVFLRQIMPGGVDESYGIQVAQLAGLPQLAVERASEILRQIESSPTQTDRKIQGKSRLFKQESLFAPDTQPTPPSPALQALKEIKVEELTPLQALNKLAQLQKISQE